MTKLVSVPAYMFFSFLISIVAGVYYHLDLLPLLFLIGVGQFVCVLSESLLISRAGFISRKPVIGQVFAWIFYAVSAFFTYAVFFQASGSTQALVFARSIAIVLISTSLLGVCIWYYTSMVLRKRRLERILGPLWV